MTFRRLGFARGTTELGNVAVPRIRGVIEGMDKPNPWMIIRKVSSRESLVHKMAGAMVFGWIGASGVSAGGAEDGVSGNRKATHTGARFDTRRFGEPALPRDQLKCAHP